MCGEAEWKVQNEVENVYKSIHVGRVECLVGAHVCNHTVRRRHYVQVPILQGI